MIKLGKYQIDNCLILAPMVGVSDLPFRTLCLQHGAGLAVGEMVTSNTALWQSEKNRDRIRQSGDGPQTQSVPQRIPQIVQIAGSDPAMMAEAARRHTEMGADIIDINMGCPAKKVLKKAAGSALLQDPPLVEEILKAVVNAVDIPVTLKIRTGWSQAHRNGVDIARLAEDCGVQMLSVHGRTRECRFKGEAEYDTIAAIKQAIQIPVIANGDITSPEKARQVLLHTDADGLMIGRAAQGRPWLFEQIRIFLQTGKIPAEKSAVEIAVIMLDHVHKLHDFYGEPKGLLFARKHLSWYSDNLPDGYNLKSEFNRLESSSAQRELVHSYIESLTHQPDQRREPHKEKAA